MKLKLPSTGICTKGKLKKIDVEASKFTTPEGIVWKKTSKSSWNFFGTTCEYRPCESCGFNIHKLSGPQFTCICKCNRAPEVEVVEPVKTRTTINSLKAGFISLKKVKKNQK